MHGLIISDKETIAQRHFHLPSTALASGIGKRSYRPKQNYDVRENKLMKLEIVKKTLKAFKGKEGDLLDYYWYIGKKEDGTAKRFGSTNGEYEEGETYDILLEDYEQSNGNTGSRELT